MDIEQLRDDAEIIRDETKAGANTAKRVGDMFVDIIDYLSSGRMKITGSVNIAVAAGRTTLQNVYNSLDSGGMAFLLISDSKGLFPSTEKYVTADTSVRSLFTADPSLGASVGDIVVVVKATLSSINIPVYRILPLNDTKAPNGSFPGAMGLESIWDKQQIDKIPNVETTANNAKAIADDNAFNTAGVWNDNMDTCIYNGFYPWCTLGRPAGSKGAFSLSVRRTATPDFNENYTIQQTCYGREGDEVGQIWKRLIFKKVNAAAEFTEWVRIDGSGGGESVYQIPGEFSKVSTDGAPDLSRNQLGDAAKLYEALTTGKIIKDKYNVAVYVTNTSTEDYIILYGSYVEYHSINIRFNASHSDYAMIYRVDINMIADDLETDSPNAVLSAKQGKVLNDKLNTLAGNVERFVAGASEEIDKVKEQVSKVYKPKGTKTTFAEVLALTDAKEGDVWDVEQAFTFNGKEYAAGTNVVCINDTTTASHDESHWDPLGGMIEGILKESDVIDSFDSFEKKMPLSANRGRMLNSYFDNLESVVDSIGGFVNKINDEELPKKASYYTINAPVEKWKDMHMHGSDLTPYFGTAKDFFLSAQAKGAIVVQSGNGSHVVDVSIKSDDDFYFVYLRQPLEDTNGLVIAQLTLLAIEDSNGDLEWSDDGADVEYSTNMSLFEQYPLEFLESILMYGVERDRTVSSPAYTRIGNMNLHRSLPIHNKMRGCLLDDNGNVVKYLNAYNWTGEVRDGSMGQVMIELPDCYCKFEEDGNIYRVKMSEYPLPGYKKWEKCYVSAYEAALNRTENKLNSVVNLSDAYRGGNNNADWDGTYHDLRGCPVTDLTKALYQTYARNRKSGSTEWNILPYYIWKRIVWLYVVEYANNNIQLPFNNMVTVEGFKQGGLGNGVTTLNSSLWTAFNSENPFIPCGYTDSLGNRTGVVPFTMPDEYGQELTVYVPRYRGIENIFGHLYKILDGITVVVGPTVENGGDNLSKVYICEDPALFNGNVYDDYRYIGNKPRNTGYIKEIIGGKSGETIPSICGGTGTSSTTYFCDFHIEIAISAIETLKIIQAGGNAASSVYAGLTYIYDNYSLLNTPKKTGVRLCFIPKK